MVGHIQDIVEASPETYPGGEMVTTKVTIGIATTPTTIYDPSVQPVSHHNVADARWSDFGRL